jgi:hypothetical protein
MFEENGGTVHEGMGPESTDFVSSKWRSARKEFATFCRWSYYPVHKRCVSWGWLRACQLATIQVDVHPFRLDLDGTLPGTLLCWQEENGEWNSERKWIYTADAIQYPLVGLFGDEYSYA